MLLNWSNLKYNELIMNKWLNLERTEWTCYNVSVIMTNGSKANIYEQLWQSIVIVKVKCVSKFKNN